MKSTSIPKPAGNVSRRGHDSLPIIEPVTCRTADVVVRNSELRRRCFVPPPTRWWRTRRRWNSCRITEATAAVFGLLHPRWPSFWRRNFDFEAAARPHVPSWISNPYFGLVSLSNTLCYLVVNTNLISLLFFAFTTKLKLRLQKLDYLWLYHVWLAALPFMGGSGEWRQWFGKRVSTLTSSSWVPFIKCSP